MEPHHTNGSFFEGQIGFDITLILIIIFVLLLRISGRILQNERTGGSYLKSSSHTFGSDALILIAFVLSMVTLTTDLDLLRDKIKARDAGEELWTPFMVPDRLLVKAMKYYYLTIHTYLCTLWAVKVSLLWPYIRMKDNMTRRVRIFLIAGTTAVVASWVIIELAIFCWCTPIQRNWTPGPDVCGADPTITNRNIQNWLHVGSDLIVLVMSIIVVRSVQLGRREHWAVIILILVGCSTIVMALIRYAMVLFAIKDKGALFDNFIYWQYLLCCTEAMVAFLVSCLPATRVLVRRLSTKYSRNKSTEEGISVLSSGFQTSAFASPRDSSYGHGSETRVGANSDV